MFREDLYPDLAATVLNQAVIQSYQDAGFACENHHGMLHNFWNFYNTELKNRGYCTGNWKWIIPPFFGSYTICHRGLNKMIEYTLKPALIQSVGWPSYLREHK